MHAVLKSTAFRIAAMVALLVALYAFVGFRIAPGLIRGQAIAAVRETYGRELQIGAVAVQPFQWQVEIRDLAFPDRDRQAMLSLRRLFIDFEVSSLWRRAWVFRELDLEGPAVRAVLRRDGTLNLSDLSPPPAAPAAAAPPAEASTLPGLWIESLAIRDGKAEYVELAGRQKPFVREFSPVGFALEDFRTTPEGGAFRLSARSGGGEQLDWNGRFALSPAISSRGEFTIAGLQAPGIAEFFADALPFGLSSGRIDLGGRYRLSLGAATELNVQIPRVSLTDLAVRARGVDTDWVTIPALTVDDATLALPARTVAVSSITLAGLKARAWLNPDGSANLTQLLAPAPQPATATATATSLSPSPSPSSTPGRPWSVSLARLAIQQASFDLEDRMHAPVKRFAVAPLNVELRGMSLDLARSLPVSIDAKINDHALLTVAGTLTPQPLSADLVVSLKQARMEILQPYILPVADLTIRAGLLAVEGRLRLEPPEREGPQLSFAGDVVIDDFRSIDNGIRQDLINFRRLQLQKLRYEMAPDALNIDLVRVGSPYARVIISREQILNISAVLDPKGAATQAEARRSRAAALAAESKSERRSRERAAKARARAVKQAARIASRNGAAAAPSPAPPPEQGMPIRIREVRVEGGRMNFSDLSIQPNFSAEVRQLNGAVTGLSSAFASRARVDLKGKVDEFSPVVISGTVQPFAFDRFTDIGLKFENIALPVFNPYSGQFAGYNIAKGKLTTDLRYQIENRRLNAAHKIRIDQLEWGEASANKGEATLPVKFATALLKDRDGVINLDVPVTGTLDDPKLRLGPIVWQIIKNLIVKAVTAPFALLGSLFAGAEQAQFVDFVPGEATLDAATAEGLAALAKGLVEKPAIAIDIPVGSLAALDTPALRERRYVEQRTAAIGAVLRRRAADDAPPHFETLSSKQKVEVLDAVLKELGGPRPEVPESAPAAAGTSRADVKARAAQAELEFLEATARGRVVLPEGELATLARTRADAIQRALMGGGEIAPSRVFLVTEGKVGAQGGKVRFQLGLK